MGVTASVVGMSAGQRGFPGGLCDLVSLSERATGPNTPAWRFISSAAPISLLTLAVLVRRRGLVGGGGNR
jgi:hypothetical protein